MNAHHQLKSWMHTITVCPDRTSSINIHPKSKFQPNSTQNQKHSIPFHPKSKNPAESVRNKKERPNPNKIKKSIQFRPIPPRIENSTQLHPSHQGIHSCMMHASSPLAHTNCQESDETDKQNSGINLHMSAFPGAGSLGKVSCCWNGQCARLTVGKIFSVRA